MEKSNFFQKILFIIFLVSLFSACTTLKSKKKENPEYGKTQWTSPGASTPAMEISSKSQEKKQWGID